MPGATPKKALPYPLGTEIPDVPYAVQQLAVAVENAYPFEIARGTVSVSVDAAVSGSATLVLPTGWDTAANINVVAGSGNFDYNASSGAVASGTPCSVVLAVKNINGTSATATIAVRYIAIRTL